MNCCRVNKVICVWVSRQWSAVAHRVCISCLYRLSSDCHLWKQNNSSNITIPTYLESSAVGSGFSHTLVGDALICLYICAVRKDFACGGFESHVFIWVSVDNPLISPFHHADISPKTTFETFKTWRCVWRNQQVLPSWLIKWLLQLHYTYRYFLYWHPMNAHVIKTSIPTRHVYFLYHIFL